MNPNASRLSELLRLSAERMRLDAQLVRLAFDHNGEVGHANESTLARFLSEQLPASIGVTSGFVIDTTGEQSKQVDVILYDAERTPLLFQGAGGVHLVPAEGVLAVIEVKTHLRSGDIAKSLANCRSVKQRHRTAYFTQAIQTQIPAYGQVWTEPPPLYAVFAASSDNFYADSLNTMQRDVPLTERVDLVCALDRGVTLNVRLDLDERPSTQMDARSLLGGHMADVPTESPLLVWYALVAGVVMRSGVRPIDISKYLRDELELTANLTVETTAAMTSQLIEWTANTTGLSSEVLHRFNSNRAALTPADYYELLRSPAVSLPANANLAAAAVWKSASDLAKAVSFEEWVELGMAERMRPFFGSGPTPESPTPESPTPESP